MPNTVYYASPLQSRLRAEETLPAKLALILQKLKLAERVKGESVAIKMHFGGSWSYTTVHPLFVRIIVQAVKAGGGEPFVCGSPGWMATAHERGYTHDTLGCPVLPVTGPREDYYYTVKREYKNIKEWRVAGMLRDASFIIGLAHCKGHPTCGYGGAIKNLAVGGMSVRTRSDMHDVVHYDRYWFKEKCPDEQTRRKIVESCPFGALVQDKKDPEEVHIHLDNCNQCKRCLKVAPRGALRIDPVNFTSFQEAVAIAACLVLSTFDKGKAIFVNIATEISPVCDCFGFSCAPVLPDAGIIAGDDMVAVDMASLDIIGKSELIAENVPRSMEVQPKAGHPFQQIHGPYKDPYIAAKLCEKMGLGSTEYDLVDVMPLEERPRFQLDYIPAG